MLRRLKKKGQSTGEYAIVFALALGAVMAMQTYVKRALQAKIKDGVVLMADQTAALSSFFNTTRNSESKYQYDPYYYHSDYNIERQKVEREQFGTTAGEKYKYEISTGEDWVARQEGGVTNISGAVAAP
jgi:hypothetical protein